MDIVHTQSDEDQVKGVMRLRGQDVDAVLGRLSQVFDIVRVVDVAELRSGTFGESGAWESEPFCCHNVWGKESRCENCISAKAYSSHSRETKLEFINDDVYFVISKYVEIDGDPFALEMVTKVNDETLFAAFGQSQLVRAIENHNQKLYVDALTGAYNRHYFEEQLRAFCSGRPVAMVDLDRFKEINDTFGHQAGDAALKAAAKVLMRNVRETDAVVRYGGDEFLVVFSSMGEDCFAARLESMRAAIESLRVEGFPDMRLTLSIGGAYGFENGLVQADRMVYEAKRIRNRVRIAAVTVR